MWIFIISMLLFPLVIGLNLYGGTQFRIWATNVLKEYMKKGFVLDDDRLNNLGGGNYFDELLARIRDIRSSERGRFWKSMPPVLTMIPKRTALFCFLNRFRISIPISEYE